MVQLESGTSEAEEMFLITVAIAVEDGQPEPVSMSSIATKLEVSNVSTNQMAHKLEGRGLITYAPYQGASLTKSGWSVASSILRSRRLWGVFLADELGLAPARADEIACDLEHVTPGDLATLLSDFLGDPVSGPRGKPIPAQGSAPPPTPTIALTSVTAGRVATVVSLNLEESLTGFVMDQGVGRGETVEVLAVGKHGDRLVAVGGAPVHLGVDICKGILVEVQ